MPRKRQTRQVDRSMLIGDIALVLFFMGIIMAVAGSYFVDVPGLSAAGIIIVMVTFLPAVMKHDWLNRI